MRIEYSVLICFIISILIISTPVLGVETSTTLSVGEVHSGDVGTLVENGEELSYGDSKYVEKLFYTSGSTSLIFDIKDDNYTGFSITPKLAVIYHIKGASREATIRFGVHWHSPANFYIKATLDVSTDGGSTWIRPDPDVEEGDLTEFQSGKDIDVPPGDSSVSLGTTGDTLSWSWDRSIGVTHVRVNIEYYEISGYIRAGILYLSQHQTYYDEISASAQFLIVLSKGGGGGGGEGGEEELRVVDVEVVADDQGTYYPLEGVKVTARWGSAREDKYTNETGFAHFERSTRGWLVNVSLYSEGRKWKDWEWVVDDPVGCRKEGVCYVDFRMGIGYAWLRCLYMPKAIPVLEYLLDGTGEGRLLSEFGNPIEKEGWRQVRQIRVYSDSSEEPIAEIRTDEWGYFNLSISQSLLENSTKLTLVFPGLYWRSGLGWYQDYWYSTGSREYDIHRLSIRVLDMTNNTPVENYPIEVDGRVKHSNMNGYVYYYTIDGTYTVHIPNSRGYVFITWEDGAGDNPRTIKVLDDTTLVAYVAKSGVRKSVRSVEWTPPYGWFTLNFTEKGVYTISLASIYSNSTHLIRAVLLDPTTQNITYAALPLKVEVSNSTVLPPEGIIYLNSTERFPLVIEGSNSGRLLLGLCALEPFNEDDLSNLSSLLIENTTYAIFNLTLFNLNTSRVYTDTLVISPIRLNVATRYNSTGVTIEFHVEYSYGTPPDSSIPLEDVGHRLVVSLIDKSSRPYFEYPLNTTTTVYLRHSELIELFMFKSIELEARVYWRGIEGRAILIPLTTFSKLEFRPLGLELLSIEGNSIEVEVVMLVDNVPQSIDVEGVVVVYVNGVYTPCDIHEDGNRYRIELPPHVKIGRGEIELNFIPEPVGTTIYYVYPMKV